MSPLKSLFVKSKGALFAFSSYANKKALLGKANSWGWLKRILVFLRSQSPFALEENKLSASKVDPAPESVSRPISRLVEQPKPTARNGEQCEVLLQSKVCSSALSTSPSPLEHSAEMHRSAVSLAAQMRVPMIKFLGARLPRPHFDPASLPPIPASSAAASSAIPGIMPSSSPPVGKIPRGQSIEEWQLPPRLRRQPISAEECAAINNGGAYGLE